MKKLFDQIDTAFIIEKEKVVDNGEDSFSLCIGKNSAYSGVFDGCGGSGFRLCRGFSKKTEAYMASRFASGAMYDWFQVFGDSSDFSSINKAKSIKEYLDKGFSLSSKYNSQSAKIGGSLVRDFPTTAAIAILSENIVLDALWAGDSRIYLLDWSGLAQVSVDDVDEIDAYNNLFDDSVMNNVLSADGKYVLNHKKINLTGPSLVITATDGCFGYFQSPMEFEFILLDSLMSADSIQKYKINLKNYIERVTGDDYSLGMIALNYGSFKKLQSTLQERYDSLKRDYINAINENINDESIRFNLWKKYKPNYEKYF